MTPQDLIWPSPASEMVWPSPASEMVWPSPNIEAVSSCNHLDNDVIDLTPGVDYTTSGGSKSSLKFGKNLDAKELPNFTDYLTVKESVKFYQKFRQ